MALILKKLYQGYFYIFMDLRDERTDDFLLLGPVIVPIIIVSLYLKFVFNWGPQYMKNRPAYNLDKLLIVFNFAQVVLNAYVVVSGFPYMASINWRCEPINYSRTPRDMHILRLCLVYYLLKVSDLADTVFFVLRKKQNQITFLHVYHHFGMVLLSWFGVRFIGGGHSTFLGYVNCFVHAVMYTYYLLTAWDKKYKKSVWWKKHITQLQLAQFLFLLLIYGQLLFDFECSYPRFATYMFVPQNIFMLILFGDFYRKTYLQGGKTNDQQQIRKGNVFICTPNFAEETEVEASQAQPNGNHHVKNT